MKKLLLSAFSFFAVSAVFAQGSLQLQNPPTVVFGNTAAAVQQATFPVVNTSSQSVNVKVARKIISEVTGSENNFCWGINCYPPNVSVSPDDVAIASNQTNNSFVADYTNNGYVGNTTIRYSFFKTTGSPDSVHATIQYRVTSPTGISKDQAANDMIGLPGPNPANEMTAIPYNLPAGTKNAKLRILNAIGGLVKEISLEKQGAAIVITSNLPNGVYFYNLQVDGRPVSTKKLIVKH